MNDPAREYFWGITLDKENSSHTWSFDEEDEDSDYLIHTLFLKMAVLGASAVKDERNIIQVETQNFDQKELKIPIASLSLGRLDQTTVDVSFGHEVPVVFRLVEGSGPVHLIAQQLVEYPEDKYPSQNESEFECTEEEDEEEEEEEESPVKSKKRKASSQKEGKSKKKGKMEVVSQSESDEDEDDEDEEEDEDESMEEDTEEDIESSPEKGKKSKKAKDTKNEKPKKGGKLAKASPKAVKKGKKAGKAK